MQANKNLYSRFSLIFHALQWLNIFIIKREKYATLFMLHVLLC